MIVIPPPSELPDASASACDLPPSSPRSAISRLRTRPRLAFFESKIRPVLVKECYSCHSVETRSGTGGVRKGGKGGLNLDSRDGLLKGGNSGKVIVPGKPAQSLIMKALREDDFQVMPPKGKLSDAIIADFEKWVLMGAPDPREANGRHRAMGMSLEDGRRFWSFKPRIESMPPAVKDNSWPNSDIDRFILARLEAKGTQPRPRLRSANAASPALRRSRRPAAAAGGSRGVRQEPVVRRVREDGGPAPASPRFGERWGRHWLDVARYADSNGKDENLTFHEAYRYRDYVIRSFNARQAVQPVHHGATRRRSAAARPRRPNATNS